MVLENSLAAVRSLVPMMMTLFLIHVVDTIPFILLMMMMRRNELEKVHGQETVLFTQENFKEI